MAQKDETFETRLREVSAVPVSLKAPFLSNLNVLDNIIVVVDARASFPGKSQRDSVLELLERLGKKELAYKHHTTLDARDYFLVQLVRASIVKEGIIIIDRPFQMFSGSAGLEFIIEGLERLEIEPEHVVIFDQAALEYRYREELCSIKKWS